jgi:hypothetical protein
MRGFLPVNVFISADKAPVLGISETVSGIANAVTAGYRVFGFYFSYYFWY